MQLLADRILYKKNWGDFKHKTSFDLANIKALQGVGQLLYSSKIVSLDDAAAELAYQVSLGLNPQEVLNSMEYFRLPADRMWIEFRRDTFLPETPPGYTGFFLEKTSEEGFAISLFDEEIRPEATTITGSLIKFHFSRNPHDLTGISNRIPLSFRQTMYYALGLTYEPGVELDSIFRDIANLSSEANDNTAWHIASRHFGFEFMYGKPPELTDRELNQLIQTYLNELAGTVRHVLAVLLLYYFPPVETYHRVPTQKGRRIINGKSKPYLSFEDVSVKIPKRRPDNPYRWVRTGLPKMEIHKRRHDVDGHFRRIRPLNQAELEALGIPEEQLAEHQRYKYVWVRAHQRGDAALGFVRKRKHLTT